MAASVSDIEFDGVGHEIGTKRLLDGVTLTIPRGQHVALIGPSGAGKTTLLRMISGIVWPTSGVVRVLEQRVDALHGRRLREFQRRIGFLHQQHNLVPQLRVAHNVLMGRLGAWSLWKSIWSLLRPVELDKARAALARLELADRLWALPNELSGGEQQRVAIARLMLQQPDIVLADEPVSALDVRLGRQVLEQLFELAGNGRTLVVSLHSLNWLELGFDRVIAMKNGAVVHDGEPGSLTRPLLERIYGAELAEIDLAQA
ncbi:MAG: phosphonate transport system ATP-binding protein [Planctomycetota bacterium]|jgi:phosphonate transport system ATP-binding protein